MIKSQPKPHQIEAVNTATRLKRFLLTMGTGSGKTITALMIAQKLRDECGVNSIVVSCPKTALATWAREIPKHSDFSYAIGYYDMHKDISVLQHTKMHQLERDIKRPSCLFVDEAHILKSADSQLSTRFRGGPIKMGETQVNVPGYLNMYEYAYGLTATPMMNHIEDLYYIVESFFPGFFGSLYQFMGTYTIQQEKAVFTGGGVQKVMEVIGFCNIEALSMRLRPIMFRYVPPYDLRFFFKFIDMTAEEWMQYRVAGRGILHVCENDARAFAGRLPDLQQVVNGSVDPEGNLRQGPELSTKEQHLLDILNHMADCKVGCVVFTTSLNTHARMQSYIGPRTRFEKCWYMKGKTNSPERAHIAANFGPNDCLFASMVGGVSLNLQAVNNVLFYDTPWSIGDVLQCAGRVTRIDSTFEHMNCMFLGVSGTIDEYKYKVCSSNLQLANAILGGFGFVNLYFSKVAKNQIQQLRRSLLWGH